LETTSADSLVALVGGGAAEVLVLDALEQGARGVIEANLMHRLYPVAERLLGCDYRGRPWAALLAGNVVGIEDRRVGRGLVEGARAEFDARGDDDGVAFALFLTALDELSCGDLGAAAVALEDAEGRLLAPTQLGNLIATQLVFGDYTRGDLRGAVARSERALHVATTRRDPRLAAVAAMHLGWLHLWTGRLDRALSAVAAADRAFGQSDAMSDCYEFPLVRTVAGVVEGLRERPGLGEAHFAAALEFADEHDIAWHGAIARTLHAEVAAPTRPWLALDEAQRALAYFTDTGDTWWPSWAASALGVAHRATGNLHAALDAGHEAVERAAFAHEAARARVYLGETMLLAGDHDGATKCLSAAAESLGAIGADLWALRAQVALAAVDGRHLEFRMRAARRSAGEHRNDPAWQAVLRGPAPLHVSLFGEPSVRVSGQPVEFASRQQLHTVCMLAAAADTGLSTETLAERLWPREAAESSKHRIDNLLSQIRHTLLPSTALERRADRVYLHLGPGTCDLHDAIELSRRLHLARDHHDREAARHKLQEIDLRPLMDGALDEWIIETQHELEARLAASDPT
jgi:tetratricopeptide (TPR) repeat protein